MHESSWRTFSEVVSMVRPEFILRTIQLLPNESRPTLLRWLKADFNLRRFHSVCLQPIRSPRHYGRHCQTVLLHLLVLHFHVFSVLIKYLTIEWIPVYDLFKNIEWRNSLTCHELNFQAKGFFPPLEKTSPSLKTINLVLWYVVVVTDFPQGPFAVSFKQIVR